MSGAEKGVGAQLRVKRRENGMSLRELARRLDVSASLVSQIETGKSQPSVRTLYAIASELGLSLDEMLERGAPRAQGGPAHGAPGGRWREIASWGDEGVEFAIATYGPGGAESAPPCAERRFGLLLSGEATVTVGIDEHRLGAGDSISLNGDESVRVRNDGSVEARAIWVLRERTT